MVVLLIFVQSTEQKDPNVNFIQWGQAFRALNDMDNDPTIGAIVLTGSEKVIQYLVNT